MRPLKMPRSATLALVAVLCLAACDDSEETKRARSAEARAVQAVKERDAAKREAAEAKIAMKKAAVAAKAELDKKLAAGNPWWKTALWVVGGLAVGGLIGIGFGAGLTERGGEP